MNKNNIIQPMFNGINSMNDIQPNFSMNNPINEMNCNNNQNMANNNIINSVNININNNINFYNNFNYLNNYFDNSNYDDMNNLSNSFNNISIPTNSDDFSFGNNLTNKSSKNTMQPISSEINILFSFTTTQVFNVSGRLNEKLSNVINRFKNTLCPEQLKGNLERCIHNGSKLDIEKTLKESGIKNGDRILFLENLSNNDNNNKEKKDSEMNSIDQLSPSGIIVKEHIHNLVYCLNIFCWKCNLCKIRYEKKYPKYYCSICNYSMCENCHDNRNYPKKKAFPDNDFESSVAIKKKFLKTAYHKHYLAYSRTSRDTDELKKWYCNNCKDTFENDVWSFYCTKCDFDICTKCAGFN